MLDPKFNELPVDDKSEFAGIPESSLTEEQKADGIRRSKAGLSINDTIAAEANLSAGSSGVDTSGVAPGAEPEL